MSFPTRAELEGLKRAALQSKCKELGIKANSKSEMLIDLVLEHYQSTSGPSRPSNSNKRKAQDEGKGRRVKAKVEPEDVMPLHTSPKRKVIEVVIRSPAKGRAKGKGKAKAMTPVDDEIDVAMDAPVPQSGPAMITTQPLSAYPTSATVIDTTVQTSIPDTRVADLELQIRNARKAGDDASRDISGLKAFQNAIQQAFGDNSPSDTLDSIGQLAKLRDLAPRFIALSQLDPVGIASRVEDVERRVVEAGETLKNNQTKIAEMKERVRQLEEKKTSVVELEEMVRQLQSQFNRIPESVFDNNQPEESVDDNKYTIIRPASAAPVAGPSYSQEPSSQLSVPQESLFPSENQNQNNGRATSVARSSRGSRQPLAEKEKETEVAADTRRSTQTQSHQSSQTQSRQSSQTSRAPSVEPYSRGRSSEPPTPSRKGKGRLIKTTLDTVNEDDVPVSPVADPFTPTTELPRSPPAAALDSASPSASVSRPGPTATFLPPLPTLSANGPITELPFKLIASSSKPSSSSSEAIARPFASSGRVARATTNRVHAPSVRLPTTSGSTVPTSQPTFSFALPGASTSTNGASTSTNGASTSTKGASSSSSAPAKVDHGFITPERLGANFSLFPSTRIDLGRTPGGLAFKTTGRAAPGTPAVTNTMYGTEVARDTRFADLPYDPDASRGSASWEELPVWPAGIPRAAANP